MELQTYYRLMHERWLLFAVLAMFAYGGGAPAAQPAEEPEPARAPAVVEPAVLHHEVPRDPWQPRSISPRAHTVTRSGPVQAGPFLSVQVNVDALGNNIVGDAANEPSIAIDPTNPDRVVIGWRQFDTVESNFRQAGYAYSHDGGLSWTFPGSLTPGVFGSDPVLAADQDGVFYYVSINFEHMRFFRSIDAGITWDLTTTLGNGLLDKPWMAVDRTDGPGRGNIYLAWSGFSQQFARSTDGGETFLLGITAPVTNGFWGTLAVGPLGDLFLADRSFQVVRSRNAQDPALVPTFSTLATVDLGGTISSGGFPNPGGLSGQTWIATDSPTGPCRGHVYLLATVHTPGDDPRDIMFARSLDGGNTWSEPVRVNDDRRQSNAWQWFGTMSVAPNGRIDAIWNDTRNTGEANLSELFYSFSMDGGLTWSNNVVASPVFDSWLGWPKQNKLGDYCHMISDNEGASLAYAATFNGEQDVYFLRLIPDDCNGNGRSDALDIERDDTADCNANGILDECEPDCNTNGRADSCDILDGTSDDVLANGIPDECEQDLDGDHLSDPCDCDIDGDGVLNARDRCERVPVASPTQPDGAPVGEATGDCNVDLHDHVRFERCLSLSGPGTSPGRCAEFLDANGDSDVDLMDFAVFQRAFTGSE